MKDYVVGPKELSELSGFFGTSLGRSVSETVLRLLSLDKVNALYSRCCHTQGAEFSSLLLRDLDISCRVDNMPLLENLPQGPFITVSNHPFGAIDGISLISVIGSFRPDYKVMVNSVLGYIEAMSSNFIVVEPYRGKKGSGTNLNGIKESIVHISNGSPLGFFPAGGVSGFRSDFHIRDNPWSENVIRLIQKANVPVLPIYFHGHNSFLFNLLGMVSWRLRSLRLATEVFRKEGGEVHLSLGELISEKQLQGFSHTGELSEFLYQKTYLVGEKYG